MLKHLKDQELLSIREKVFQDSESIN